MAAREIVACGQSASIVDAFGLCPHCGLPVDSPSHDTGGNDA